MKNSIKLSRRELLAGTMVAGTCPRTLAQGRRAPAEPFVPSEGPNKPMGVGKGIHPGRVVWVHNPEVARWDGQTERMSVKSATGEWWDDSNCDPKIVDAMFSTSLQGLTGKKSDHDAWDALFRHFNKMRGFGNAGYHPGEKIAIKINMNNDRSNTVPWPSGRGMPSPQVAHALLRGLVQNAKVPGKDITLFDATDDRYIGDPIYNRIMSDPDPRLHEINFQVARNRAGNGRVGVVPDTTDPIKFSDPKVGGWVQTDSLPIFVTHYPKVGNAFQPKCVVEAKYRINFALLRAHGICGVTLCAKNYNGTLYWPDQNFGVGSSGYWGPRVYHNFISRMRPLPSYNAFVDIIGHRQIGGKELLYMLDGLYSAEESEVNVVRFLSFGDKWPASLFMSQDPVAIDSVGLDFLRAEQRATQVNGGNPDNFMHEAALIGDAPSGTKYDPEQDGTILDKSLGVHEHWNNPTDKKYSRNLGKKEGIELVALSAKVGKLGGKS